MKTEQIIDLVLDELKRAENKWPEYYSDAIHAAALINEEAGETIQAALDFTYGKDTKQHFAEEAIQTAAMCFRLLKNIGEIEAIKNFIDYSKNGEQLTIYE